MWLDSSDGEGRMRVCSHAFGRRRRLRCRLRRGLRKQGGGSSNQTSGNQKVLRTEADIGPRKQTRSMHTEVIRRIIIGVPQIAACPHFCGGPSLLPLFPNPNRSGAPSFRGLIAKEPGRSLSKGWDVHTLSLSCRCRCQSFLHPLKTTSSRPEAAHLPPQWRDPCIALLLLLLSVLPAQSTRQPMK